MIDDDTREIVGIIIIIKITTKIVLKAYFFIFMITNLFCYLIDDKLLNKILVLSLNFQNVYARAFCYECQISEMKNILLTYFNGWNVCIFPHITVF